uniref:Uncharacterized protein n=1 Tax=Globisporangium ultimum (strain ATCC 200006 / CBS 805.95 / DAOM BR144) TaxID=431595 RepID=K3WNW3_GLOUD
MLQELASSGTQDAQLASEQAVIATIELALPPWFSRKVLKFGDNLDTTVVILAQFMGVTALAPFAYHWYRPNDGI